MARIANLLASHGGALFSFGAIQAAQMLTPLLALPWLGRVLGPSSFGLLMYMCLIPPVIALFMDWGITLGGARQAALCQGRPRRMARLLGAVLSAKIILAIFCLAGAAVCCCFLPHAREWPGAYFLAVGVGMARGASPLWYYQGTGKNARQLAVFEVLAAMTSLVLVFMFVRAPENWALYLFFLMSCKGCVYLWLYGGLCKKYRPHLGVRAGFAMLGRTRELFGGAISTMVYTNGSQLVFGYFLPASQLGALVATSKILRALAGVINPFTQTIFPHICSLRGSNSVRARKILRVSLAGTFFLMAFCAALVWIFAPCLIRLALGPDYGMAVRVLRIMICAAPFMACEYMLAAQILVPYGQERQLMLVQGRMAALSLPLAAVLAAIWGLTGAAFLSLLVEGAIVAGLILAIRAYCPAALFK